MKYSFYTTTAWLLALALCGGCQPASQPTATEPPTPPVDSNEFAALPTAIAIVAHNLDSAIHFYQDVLGLTPTGGFDLDAEFGRVSGLTGDQPLSVKTFTTGTVANQTIVKLMTFGPAGKTHPRPAFVQDDTGVQYLTIMVKSITPFLERLKANQVKLLGETPIKLGESQRQTFVLVQDPDGNFVELIEE